MLFLLSKAPSAKPRHLARGFTLAEALITMAVSVIFLSGVMAVVISLARTASKNARIELTATTARQLQEFITQELSSAINFYDKVNQKLTNRPTFYDGDGNTPTSYRQIHYRAPVGPPGVLRENVAISSNTVRFFAPDRLKPQIGDFLILDTPKLGSGIPITAVADGRAANTDGEITVTLSQSLDAGTVPGLSETGLTHAPANSRVEIQRARAFIVAPPLANEATTTLSWAENLANGARRELTNLIYSEKSHLFRRVPDDNTKPEVAIGWFLVLFDASPTSSIPGRPMFFSSASIGGQNAGGSTSLIMPKSGNSMALANPFLANNTPITTRYSSSSSTSSSQSSSSSTSSSKTSSSKTTSSKSSSSSTSSSKTTSSKTTSSKSSSSSTSSSKTTSSKSSSSSTSSSKTTSSKTTSSKSSSSSTSSSKTTSSKTTSTKTSSSKSTTTVKGGTDG